jgi:autotransporter-associated beta strand protein
MMGTGAVTINSFGQLDFNGATDTIGNVAIVATGATGATTPIINTAGTGNLTIGTLGITPIDGFTTLIDTGGTGKLTLGGTLTFTAAGTGQARISGDLNLGGGGRTFSVGAGTGTASAVTGLNESYDLLVDAVISGAVGSGLTKSGGGLLKLSSANTFLGGVTLSGGTLNINNDNNLGTGGLTFSDNATLQFATGSTVTLAANRSVTVASTKTATIDAWFASGTISGIITGAGNLAKTGIGILTLNASNTFTGTTTVTGGTITLGVADALSNSSFVTTGSGAGIGIDVNGFATPTLGGLSGAVDLAAAITGYSVVTGITLNPITTTNQSYSGSISNGSGNTTLTKTGAGVQILSGANTYTGATTITGGVLKIDGSGSLSASSAVTVSSLGALGGTGTIYGNVTLNDTGGIDLHSQTTPAVGTLTIKGDLAIDGTAGENNFYFNLGTTTNGTDKIVMGSGSTVSMTNSGAGVIRPIPLGTGANRINAGTYTLIQGGSGGVPSAGDFSLQTTAAFGVGYSLGVSGNNLQLTTTQLAAGSATGWTGGSGTTASWTDSANWSAGVPGYTSAVTMYNSGAAQLTNTLDGDADIHSLIYPAAATTAATIDKGTLTGFQTGTLTIENAAGITANTPSSGTVTHTINANVGLAANQTWTVNPSSTLTLGGNVIDMSGMSALGGYTLTKAGAGTLNLQGNTSVGSLSVATTGAGSTVTIGTGGTGSLTVGTGLSSNFYVGYNAGLAGTVDASASAGITANVGRFYVGVTDGTNNNCVGNLYLGTTNTITAGTLFAVGSQGTGGSTSQGNTGVITTPASSTTTIHTPIAWFGYGPGNGTTDVRSTFLLGSGASLILDGSIYNNPSGRARLVLGYGAGQYGPTDRGIMDLSAGTASLTLSSLAIATEWSSPGNALGSLTFSGNASNHLDISGLGNVVTVGINTSGTGATANGTLTINNLDATSSITSTDNSTAVVLGGILSGSGTVSGTMNLNGGTLGITTTGTGIGTTGSGGTSLLRLNGGTLKAGASSSSFISGLTNAYVQGGGVTFNTGANSITVPQALLQAPSTSPTVNYGLAITTLTPSAGGSGYSMTSPPTVTFSTPAGGTAATGFAVVNTAGQVTGIVVTSPGSGYTNGQTATITLSGSGGGTFTNPTATVDQSVGGLTKIGNGTLTLTNANTYTGDTTVSVGTLLVNNTTGSGTGTGAVNVSTVATLGGNGTIGGSTTISGDHTPGLSAGIQTFTNSLAYAATSNLKWELNDDVSAATTGIRGTDFDGVDVTGGTFAITPGATIDLSFGGAVNFLDSFWGINRNWLVADLGAGVTGDGGSDLFTIGSITGGTNYSGSLGSFTVTRPADVNGKNDVQLNWTAGVVMTPFESWMAANYPGIPDADNDPDDDPDKDGANNLSEFAFSGNPLDGADRGEIHGLNADSGDVGTDKEMILTVAVRTGVAFSTPGSPAVSDAVVDGLTYKIHGSNNLDSWAVTVNPVTAITAGLPSLPTGYQYVSFSLNGSDGLPGKGFLRAEVSQP